MSAMLSCYSRAGLFVAVLEVLLVLQFCFVFVLLFWL